jgi:hypothetical protein
MWVFIGKFLRFINRFAPNLAFHWRGRALATIMSQHTFGFMQKLSVLTKAERFLATVDQPDRDKLKESLNLPKWANTGMVDGYLRTGK